MDWKNKKVLVCGGAGMIGSHLTKRLTESGAKVTVADDLSSGSMQNLKDSKKHFSFYEGDLRSAEVCYGLCYNQDAIFQLAADMGGIGYITRVGADIMHNNVLINLNMLKAAEQNNVPLYFYSSSACVYPEYKQTSTEVVPLKENDAYPAMPDQFYGWEKLFTELMCEAYARDYHRNIRVARFHNVYGSAYTAFDAKRGKAPCHLILKAIRYPEQPFVIWGDGKQTRSFLYIDDCIDMILGLMDSSYKSPVNIGSDRLVTIKELADIINEISGKGIQYQYDITKPQGVRGRNADLTLCKEAIGLLPRVELEEGLREVYNWAMTHYNKLEGI